MIPAWRGVVCIIDGIIFSRLPTPTSLRSRVLFSFARSVIFWGNGRSVNRLFARKKRYGEDPFVLLSEMGANKDRIFVFFSIFTSASARARARARTSRSFPCSPLFFTLISNLLHALRIRRDGPVEQSRRKRLKKCLYSFTETWLWSYFKFECKRG